VRAHPHDLTRHCDVDARSHCAGLAEMYFTPCPLPGYETWVAMRCSACDARLDARGVLFEDVSEALDAWDEDWGGGV